MQKLINLLAAHESSKIGQLRKKQICQKIACTFQTIRSHNIDMIRSKDCYSLIDRPIPHPSSNPYNINHSYNSSIPRSSSSVQRNNISPLSNSSRHNSNSSSSATQAWRGGRGRGRSRN